MTTRSRYELAHPTTGKTWLPGDEVVDVCVKDTDNPGYGFIKTWPRSYGDAAYQVRYFQNDIYGADMNVNGKSDSDTFEYINDGNDHVYWTKSVIVGTVGDFPYSTAQNHTPGGASSVSTIPSGNGEIVQFARPGGLISTATYATLEMWVWIAQWTTGTTDILMYLWNTQTDTQVGEHKHMNDYLNTEDTQEWQPANFIMEDICPLPGCEFDAIRFEMIDISNKADVYFDDIVLREYGSTNPVTFTLQRNPGEVLLIDGYQISFGSPTYDPFWDGVSQMSPIPKLDHTKILDIAVPNGFFYRRFSYGVPRYTYTWRSLADFLSLPHFEINNLFAHPDRGGFLTLRYKFPYPAVLYDQAEDYVKIDVHDDFTAFSHFRYSADTRVVGIQNPEEEI